ncbi:VIT1/CCC1 transporter family protein [Marinactinospora thermotolerans]|uniref:Predicted Fe2+/Mn2+ transporter, VIT1/CCC1 family n=1 Tax=Marinactinospora thermotolerans DSM 45154 TaxID=1122192 RepID=A0A1T4NMT5_9ACTN|nr:VIT1/CCC1 family protein [Marinactinospora thermotolerans]SJZ80579.1 Predicted Fe2+/Mn2+ transporter, VIT1/CCC1 family [Marinactinospora thermotolerans DSM 45154]
MARQEEPEGGPAPSSSTLRRWRRRLADEREAARTYRALAARRTGEEREILLGLAAAEERHVAHWEDLLGDRVGPPRRGGPRSRLLNLCARRFGWVFVLALLQRAEDRSLYEGDADASPAMAADERVHAEVVRGLAARGRARMSGTLRAAVFGANDGLVSNAALVLGVIGGGAGSQTVLLTGLSGLLAGALSMAAGEFVSVSSQRELLAASAPGGDATAPPPALDVDVNELALVYRARGMAAEEARRRADAVLRHGMPAPGALGAGGGGDEVVGSGIGAAVSSFAFFATGAAIPVLPFLAGGEGTAALVVAGVLTGIGLLLTGAVVGLLSGASPLRRALRQFAIGAAAAAATYLLGLAFGTAVG